MSMLALVAVTAVTAIAGGVAAYQQGKMAADIAESNADAARQAGEVEAHRRERAQRRMRGLNRATMAAHGVEVNEGTPIDLEYDQMLEDQHELDTIRWNAEIQALNQEGDADMARAQGQAGLIKGIGQAGTSVLGAKVGYDRQQAQLNQIAEMNQIQTGTLKATTAAQTNFVEWSTRGGSPRGAVP